MKEVNKLKPLNELKICIYLRKSRKDRDNPNESIEETLNRHKTTLLAYAQENELNIVEIKLEVESGESLAKRPKMIEMLDEIEDGKYDGVLVMDFDRLGRGDMLDQGIVISTLKRNDVKIITPDRIYDLDDDLDEEMVDFNAFFARKELKMINKRLKRGRMKSLEEGNYISGREPWGYFYDKGKKELIINEEEAAIFKDIVDMYINQGMGAEQITNHLNSSGIKSKMGKEWNKGTLMHMIKNPLYIGKVTWSKLTSNPKIYEGKHDAIIDQETYDKIMEVSKERYIPRVRNSYKARNPLAGIIKCSNCCSTMSLRAASKKNQRYNRDTLRCYKNCGNMSTFVDVIEERLVNVVYQELKNIEKNFEYKDNNKKPKKVNNTLLKNAKKELDKTYEQKNSLYELLEQKIYDNKTFLERMDILTNRIEELNDSINKLEEKNKELIEQSRPKYSLKQIQEYINFIDSIYWESDANNRNKFLKKVVDHADYTKSEYGVELFRLEVFLKI